MLILLNIVVLIALLSLIAYIKKKGENLASKQDVAKITDEMEQVKINYSLLLEEVKAQHQLYLTIFPEQIKKHQEAFTLLIKVLHSLFTPTELPETIWNCQEWFNENNIYLGKEAQNLFKTAYLTASIFPSLWRSNPSDKTTREAYDKIIEAVTFFQESLQRLIPTLQKQGETPK